MWNTRLRFSTLFYTLTLSVLYTFILEAGKPRRRVQSWSARSCQ